MLEDIIRKFKIDGEIINYDVINMGNINSTYVITMYKMNGEEEKYLLQKINNNVFTEPSILMKNIENVTNYLEMQLRKNHDTKHQVLKVVHTKDGKSLCKIKRETGEKDYYRVYHYIDNAISFDNSKDAKIVYNTGKAFGNFQKLLKDYPIKRLYETIKDFHNTEKRYEKLMLDIKIDAEDRVSEVANEILFLLLHEEYYSLITDELGKTIPYRVTHNDTKVNNVLMNKETGDFLAVIDLDTVMPGSMLYDYGDGIRSTASTATEDETNLSKVKLDLELFEAYTDGYLSEMAEYLTYEEVNLMAEAIRIITLELAIRFLDDYIIGDDYFKTNYEKHNLDRARNQIALVMDIEKKFDYMKKYIQECYEKYLKENKGVSRKRNI